MNIWEKVGYVVLGIVVAVCLFCLVVAIACAVNGISFSEQIIQWAGSISSKAPESIEPVCLKLM